MYRFYSNPDENNVRVSVVGAFNEDEKKFEIAVSRCSAKDSFFKKKGRMIAEGRLKAGKLYGRFTIGAAISRKKFIEIALDVAKKVSADARLMINYE